MTGSTLIVTPPIYFVLFFFTLGMIFIGGILKKNGLIKNFLSFYALVGCMAVFVISLILFSWGMAHSHVDFFILVVILLMAVTATVLVWACMRYVLSWEYVRDPLYIALIFGRVGRQCHQLRAYLPPGSPLYRTACGRVGPDPDDRYCVCHVPAQARSSFSRLFTSCDCIAKRQIRPFWYLVLLAMIVVGLAPGVRDMIRMVLYV